VVAPLVYGQLHWCCVTDGCFIREYYVIRCTYFFYDGFEDFIVYKSVFVIKLVIVFCFLVYIHVL
jgi:hypothetical protein